MLLVVQCGCTLTHSLIESGLGDTVCDDSKKYLCLIYTKKNNTMVQQHQNGPVLI